MWQGYDVDAPSNRLWQSDAGAWLFEQHPQWPEVWLGPGDPFLELLNDDDLARRVLAWQVPLRSGLGGARVRCDDVPPWLQRRWRVPARRVPLLPWLQGPLLRHLEPVPR
jgi:hypothetical protein